LRREASVALVERRVVHSSSSLAAMVFSSPTFLFLFLPVVLALAFALRERLRVQNAFLLVASLFFYASGDGAHLGLFLGSIALNYGFGLAVERAPHRRVWLGVGVAVNVALLLAFKYANFLAASLNDTVGAPVLVLAPIALPVGISFYTFHAISYLVDVGRGRARAQRSPLELGLYLALFPQLIAGPIVRYGDLEAQLAMRRVELAGFASGARRFSVGLAKKVLIADSLATVIQRAFDDFEHAPHPALAWLGALCFMAQIYYDFSGYSDMAIGLGRMLGFEFKENFAHPYTATSVVDFWRRWHISLSTWFRDYVYIPLGGNRVSPIRRAANLWLVFILCGLWHGASSSFAAWGLYHGGFLVLERTRFGALLARAPRWLALSYVSLVVLVGWVLFRADTLPHAVGYLVAMSDLAGALVRQPSEAWHALTAGVDAVVWLALLAALAGVSPWPLAAARAQLRRFGSERLSAGVPDALALLVLWLALLSVSATTFRPFLYFRF
jgi:alginate O-acetyltransferase complex protein AlgI